MISSDFNELLKMSSFKHQFLYKKYEGPVYGAIQGKTSLYCATDDKCKKFYGGDGVIKFEEIYDFYGYYLQGDTLMFHTKHADLMDQ